MTNVFLSKSSYCKCLQCPKIFWLKRYKPEESVQSVNPRIFENGKKVGILAQDLFGKKHDDIQYNKNLEIMIEKTREYMDNKPNIITEASFSYNNNFCMVDILINDEDGVEIYEVKSSTRITDIYIDDASFQYFILSNLGFNVKKVCIVYINNQYVREDELNLDELFHIEDITGKAIEKQEEIRNNVKMINRFMNEHGKDNEPDISTGKQCSNPYPCDFWKYCNKNTTNENDTLYTVESSDIIINKEAINDFLDTLRYPLYFIDYETFMSPMPEIFKTRPYQQIPFQYSLHILKDKDAPLEHKEFLADINDNNFVRHFAESMVNNIPDNGSVLVYNKTFEGRIVNKELIRMYPDLEEEIDRINSNMIDLMIPFRKKEYVTKEMKDSYSLKNVLPALYPNNPELDYENLSIVHDGEEASEAFLSLKDKTSEEQKKIRKGLLDYCKLDTYAMVKIFYKFKEVTRE